jgi:hypothetical protein
MKAILKIFILFLFAWIIFFNNNVLAQKQVKEIKKEFQISKGDVLKIENKFGDINIMNWDQPNISISVKLSAEAKSDAAANSIIEKMAIEINKDESTIYAKTVLGSESETAGKTFFSVDYVLYVPKWINLNLVNKFGNIHIDEITGTVNINLKHGQLRIMTLNHDNTSSLNQIAMAFSTGVINNAGSLKVDLSYSKLEIEKSDEIVADTKYSGININNCGSFECESKYDNFKLNEIRNLTGNLQYSNLRIGKFSGKIKLESTYSGVKIEEVLSSFESIKSINLRGTYKIGIDPDVSFDLHADSKRGDLSIEGFTIVEKKTDGNNKFIHAKNGNTGIGKPINITVEDGSVSIYKN